MKGDLLTVSFDRALYRVQLNGAGNKVAAIDKLVNELGVPLDVTAQSSTDNFPGTIWVADYQQNTIHILEPTDY